LLAVFLEIPEGVFAPSLVFQVAPSWSFGSFMFVDCEKEKEMGGNPCVHTNFEILSQSSNLQENNIRLLF